MKTLSLWQPWATLIAIGAKRIETRSWYTPYRGPLAIHAAKTHNQDMIDAMMLEPFRYALKSAGLKCEMRAVGGYHADQIPLGCVVATCDLVECIKVETHTMFPNSLNSRIPPNEPERSFGDYTPGRYAWFLENIQPVNPFPFKGRQQLFEVPDELITQEQITGVR